MQRLILLTLCLILLINLTVGLTSRGASFHPKNKLKGLPRELLTRWETTKKPRQITTYFDSGFKALRVTPGQFGGDPTGQVRLYTIISIILNPNLIIRSSYLFT